jgi:hypothetical protein
LVLLAILLLASSASQARLHPYYVLQGVSFGQQKPRILFVLDTSGSMTWRADATNEMCDWDECEAGVGAEQSRIHAARSAVRSVVQESDGVANFGLMTFDQRKPPTAVGHVPDKCQFGNQDYRRFRPFIDFKDAAHAWKPANLFGFSGGWELCGDNRPYPYLRWDELGVGSTINADDQLGAIPASPLRSTDQGDFMHPDNTYRRVQWFPSFLGLRVNLNAETDPDQEILDATYGDFAVNPQNRTNEVWEQDFYYWPYVDGFPGYSFHSGSDAGQLGVVDEDHSNNAASLYAPFFLESAVQSFPHGEQGPASIEEATGAVLAKTDTLPNGGVDASGGTPWKSVVGPIVQSPAQNNAIFSHTTVASYLRFTQNIDEQDLCVPLVAVLITDGDPYPAQEGGSGLHSRLSALRTELGTRVYVVGFVHSSTSLNNMACAANGSDDNQDPCLGAPSKNWDTCFDSGDPANACAYLTNSAEELAETLTTIIEGEIALDVGAGPGASVNDFGVGAGGKLGEGETLATTVAGYTEWPGWRGHVVRELCTDIDPDTNQLADYCEDQPFDEVEETFGPCPQSRDWDAGECLQQTFWKQRRLYVNDANNDVFRIADPNGKATPQFIGQLNDPALQIPGAPFNQGTADLIAAFIQGENWPDQWKLPGLANSAPIVVRRIPQHAPAFSPSVGIRDPHCAGRKLLTGTEVHQTLIDFAKDAWDPAQKLQNPSEHYEYQEAVLVGDDLGVLHAFQFDSGNELWGLLPRFLLDNAVRQFEQGPGNMGQPDEVEEHLYGIAATLNHGWSYDENADNGNGAWRHLAVIGAGIGASEFMALDLSHMSPAAQQGPIELLWSSEDPALKATYDELLGETWARPALSYQLPPDDKLDALPETYLVLGSGYPDAPATGPLQGRSLLISNAVTGVLLDSATLPVPNIPLYEQSLGSVVDPAVGTHCVSRYWAEMQETYITDPAGRLFRWDLGRNEGHESDGGQVWNGSAQASATFRACQGSDDFSCVVDNTNKGDPFAYGAAVVANDRIDDQGVLTGAYPDGKRDQFLVALISGSVFDDAIDGGEPANDYHSSIYILADDHRQDANEGFDIPNGGGKTAAGDHSHFFRLALSDLERERKYQPFPNSPIYTETRSFSKAARPIRAPSIRVTGLVEQVGNSLEVVEGVELYYIEYKIYEPGDKSCDQAWYDEANEEWVYDQGATYTVRLRLTVRDGEAFDFKNGASVDPSDVHGITGAGLQLGDVEQDLGGDCADGVCGPGAGTGGPKVPCDPNADASPGGGQRSIAMSTQDLEGFTPLEVALP